VSSATTEQGVPGFDPAISIPVLASLCIDESAQYYCGRLGFSEICRDENYLIVRRDQIEIHFWLAEERVFPEHTSCYIRGGQILALYKELRAKGLERLSVLSERPWGMTEFHLNDPHGNLLRFGCADAG